MLSSPRRKVLLVLAAALAVAFVMTETNLRFASSQNVTVVSRYTEQPIPLDNPAAPIWETTFAVQLPLSMQMTAPPFGGGSIKDVTVSSLHDDRRIYFRLQWADDTMDDSTYAPQQFRDAAAIEFPAPAGATVPFFCMGQGDAQVNIWQWKADWQAQVNAGQRAGEQDAYANAPGADAYAGAGDSTFFSARAAGNIIAAPTRTTPAENLVAGGFGTLTTANDQDVQGDGSWNNGQWSVVLWRDMDLGGQYATLTPGTNTSSAFAVWNGSQGDRNGQKSVSSFVALSIDPATGGRGNTRLVLGLLGGLGGVALVALTLGLAGRYYLKMRDPEAEKR